MPRDAPGGAVLHAASADIGGLKKFLLHGNVVDLAVGIVIGPMKLRKPYARWAAPSGADIADHAAQVLAGRLTGQSSEEGH
jgi:hypothetical protein